MNMYSTCADCGLVMQVADPHMTTHPNCVESDHSDRDLAEAWTRAVIDGDSVTADQLGKAVDREPRRAPMVDAALIYTRWGWPVFPLLPGKKTPATRHGFKEATTDPARICAWWKSNPAANIGLATGHLFDVIDVDAPVGYQSYLRMQDADVLPAVHGKVFTAGAGLHLYVERNGSGVGNRAGIIPGIDYRADGGYVVAPPSTVNGRRYEWMSQPSPIIVHTSKRSAV